MRLRVLFEADVIESIEDPKESLKDLVETALGFIFDVPDNFQVTVNEVPMIENESEHNDCNGDSRAGNT